MVTPDDFVNNLKSQWKVLSTFDSDGPQSILPRTFDVITSVVFLIFFNQCHALICIFLTFSCTVYFKMLATPTSMASLMRSEVNCSSQY